MPYTEDTGFIANTVAEIEEQYRLRVNELFNTSYSTESFKGSGFWLVFQNCILADSQLQNSIVDLVEIFNTKIEALRDDFFTSQAGFMSGLYEALMNLTEIVNDINIYNPQDDDSFRGKIAIAVEYKEGKQDDRNSNDAIANTIINNIGAGIHTDSESADKAYLGVLNTNGQVFEVYWKVAILRPVFLKLTYKKELGYSLPADDEIRDILMQNLATYQFGSLFTPAKYVKLCNFDFFRDTLLEYSFDQGDNKTWQSTEITPDFWLKYQFINDSEHIIIESGE